MLCIWYPANLTSQPIPNSRPQGHTSLAPIVPSYRTASQGHQTNRHGSARPVVPIETVHLGNGASHQGLARHSIHTRQFFQEAAQVATVQCILYPLTRQIRGIPAAALILQPRSTAGQFLVQASPARLWSPFAGQYHGSVWMGEGGLVAPDLCRAGYVVCSFPHRCRRMQKVILVS